MIKHHSPISGVAAFGNEWVATAGYDNVVILWDARTKRAVARSVHDHLANQCSFHPSGKLLGTSSSDYTARIWEVPTMRLLTVLPDHGDDVEAIAFHPTKPLVATACRDHVVRVFDLSGQLLHRLHGHTLDVNSVDWADGRDEIISASDDGTVRRWCAVTGQQIEEIRLEGSDADAVAIAPDGTIFCASWDGTIAVIADGKARIVKAHAAGIKRIAYDQGSSQLVSISYDRGLKVWKYADGGLALVAEAALPSDVWPRSCAFQSGTSLVLGTFGSSYASFDMPTQTWDLASVEPTPGINAVAVLNGAVYTVGDAGIVKRDEAVVAELGSLCNFLTAASPVLLTGGQSGQVFDGLSGRVLHQHHSPLNCGVAFFRDGKQHVAIGSYSGEALIFEISENGDVDLVLVEQFHSNAIKGITYANGLLFSVSAGSVGAFHRTSDFACVRRVEGAHDRISNACAALPEGGYVSVGRDLTMRIWRNDGIERLDTPHTNSIKCTAVCSEGRYVASGSYTGQVAIYDLERRAWTKEVRPTAAGISSLTYAPEIEQFLASSYDGNVYQVGP